MLSTRRRRAPCHRDCACRIRVRMSPNHIRNKSDRLDSVGLAVRWTKARWQRATPLALENSGWCYVGAGSYCRRAKEQGYPHQAPPLASMAESERSPTPLPISWRRLDYVRRVPCKHGRGRDRGRTAMKLSFHSLRHTAVSLLKDAGVPDAGRHGLGRTREHRDEPPLHRIRTGKAR